MEKLLLDAGSSSRFESAHATENAMRCLRLYALDHERGERAENLADALVKGSIIHVGLAHRYARMWATQNQEDPEAFHDPITAMKLVAPKFKHVGVAWIERCISLFKFYELFYRTEVVEVLHVEEVLTTNFKTPAKWASGIEVSKHTQRIDAAWRERDGRVYFVDHKTTGRLSKDSITKYTLSGQFIGLAHLGREMYGKEFGGVKVNFLSFGDMKFMRAPMDPTPDALRNLGTTILEARERVAKWRERGVPPEQWPQTLSEQACVTSYGPCKYFNACQWGPSALVQLGK